MDDEKATAQEISLTEDELLAYAEEISQQVLGVGAREAWERVKKGELAGTLLASKLSQVFFLIEDSGVEPSHE